MERHNQPTWANSISRGQTCRMAVSKTVSAFEHSWGLSCEIELDIWSPKGLAQ